MILFKLAVALCATIVGVRSDVGVGQNAYLPPDKGYHYPTPSIPFITPSRPPRPPPTIPPYKPTPSIPPYKPPPYVPPTPTIPPYKPPTPSIPPYKPPTYVPPPPSRPTIPPYRPTPTIPPYRPPTFVPPSQPPTRPPTRPPYTPTQPPYIGQPSGEHHVHGEHEHHHEPGMPFDFSYAVNDIEHGNDYSHNAISDGDITRGEYRIQLPDGRLQVVKYTADWRNGFNAQVSYEGQPSYPQPSGYKY